MEPRNKEVFQQTQSLAEVFVRVMGYSFVESYGTLFDRVEALVYGDADLIAKILELRKDIKEEELSKCLSYTQRLVATLMKSDIYKEKPHPSTEEGYKNEIAWFLTKVIEVRKNQSNFFPKKVSRNIIERICFLDCINCTKTICTTLFPKSIWFFQLAI